jgi:glycine/D-amino acid oxidase-like deaminating enzyme
VAYHLARQVNDCGEKGQGIDSITVMDAACSDMYDPGPTTEASFGWINANFEKKPRSYQQFNVLGMHAWRHDPVLNTLPRWNGSIVHVPKRLDDATLRNSFGFYHRPIGPLTESELRRMEPNVSFAADDSSFYLFPNEGSVDPSAAVQTMRLEAAKLGVSFLWKHRVLRILQNSDGIVNEVEYTRVEDDDGGGADSRNVITLKVSEIVIAAGLGSADLCGLPLQRNATLGRTVQYEKKNPETAQDPLQFTVNRVIVDMVHQYHILQRRCNGIIVVGGGGYLQMGGTSSTTTTNQVANNEPKATTSSQQDESSNESTKALTQLDRNHNIGSPLLCNVEQVGMKEAHRPIPLDGLPCIGYLPNVVLDRQEVAGVSSSTTTSTSRKRNVYAVLSHSGITLAPLLGALAAAELLDTGGTLSLDVLQPYRPERWLLHSHRSERCWTPSVRDTLPESNEGIGN